jgi:hypothetical protein
MTSFGGIGNHPAICNTRYVTAYARNLGKRLDD